MNLVKPADFVARNAAAGRYPATMDSLRHLLRRRQANGLDRATFKIGRLLLIDLDSWEEVIASFRDDRVSAAEAAKPRRGRP